MKATPTPHSSHYFYLVKYTDGRWADLYCTHHCAQQHHTNDIEQEHQQWLLPYGRKEHKCFHCDKTILTLEQYDHQQRIKTINDHTLKLHKEYYP